MTRTALATALLAVLLAGCGGSGHTAPRRILIHGTMGTTFASSCDLSSLEGTQVDITSPSGKLLTVVTLPATPHTKTLTVDGTPVTAQVLAWRARVPVLPRYGLRTGSLPVYWISRAQGEKGTDLSC